MATNVTLNGVTYAIPAEGDDGWGTVLSNFFIAIASSTLQKSGGTFTLTAEANFGATFGLKAAYLKTQATNPSATGMFRLGNNEAISWRNAANGADLSLKVDATDNLNFNGASLSVGGTPVQTAITVADTSTISLSLPASELTASIVAGSIDNSMINAAAAIAYSKLDLAGGIVNADINAAAAIAYSKLNLAGAIVNADISASAAIAYSKLSLTGAILNADLAGSIAYSKLSLTGAILDADLAGNIAHSKLVALTASRAMVTDVSGFGSASSVTATELGYLSGVTSAIQTQVDAKQAGIQFKDEGSNLGTSGTVTSIDFTGSNVSVSRSTDAITVAITASAALSVVSKTTTYTATTADDFISVSTGSAWTLTLYAASGNSGKVLRIKKTSSDANALTIDANASETIDGALTTSLNTQYEELTLICDGTNWHILSRDYPRTWQAYTPTGSWVSFTTYTGFWRRVGDSMEIAAQAVCSGAPTAANFTITIPSGYSIDVGKMPTRLANSYTNLGSASMQSGGNSYGSALVGYTNTTTLDVWGLRAGAAFGHSYVPVTNLAPETFGSTDFVVIVATVPIVGWN